MRYRRALIGGASYFFTVNLADRYSGLLVERVNDLRDVVREVRAQHPFEIIAWVVMPNHLHAIWRLPDGDSDFSMRWGLIEGNFSRRVPTIESISASRKSKGERGLWQKRFWEHLIRDDNDLQRHVDYIHYNPVKHGFVRRAVDWEYSSIHRAIRLGWMTPDWGCADDIGVGFGER